MRLLLALLLTVGAAVALTACAGDDEAPARPAQAQAPFAPAPLTSAGLRRAVGTRGLVGHLRRLQAIAREHGGNRAAGTPGGEASIDMVAGRLRAAGYRVRLQDVPFPFFEERARPRVSADGRALRARADIATLAYSAGGRADGRAVRVPGLGCAAEQHAGVGRGDVAVVRRGTCTLRTKARLAEAAGATAVLIVNSGGPGETAPFAGTLGSPGVGIPVVGTSTAAGEALASARRVTVAVDATSERRTTRNVIADTPRGAKPGTVMLGAHVDSVTEGPGINDNGTGVATLLEIAERMAEREAPGRRVRFAFWGAEELGLHGSRRYVRTLPDDRREALGAYINLDMTGSPNPVRFVYDSARAPRGSARIERVLRAHFRSARLAVDETGMRGGSDHAPFLRAGVPAGGLFTGAGGAKSAEQARRFGGRAGRPLDRCYHRACDTVANVDRRVLGQMADAAAHAVVALSRR
ncbi:MAG: Uncharacterized lipoprotein aminopeptidase LpqL [uncultured Solirubrobacteraceae bacterium]|uniref:Uncharacterized lipoprotein aminopeptidase LpqL n=1 Tax=uncultured Solirubrobacteraceae bacterium TaxID=1162706 RepID=A0A6J4TUD5_9ACTN|nr:MAG: Uncharacterized lipoprotein aminopeptidase LpqL [uncultured Solirubrobacteraceae bacterium]